MAAAASAQPPYIDIERQRYAAIPNPKKSWSAMEHVVDYTKSANGAFRCLQFLERVTRLVVIALKKMGSAMAAFFESLAGKLATGWAWLTIPRLPEVTKKAWAAISNWSKTVQGPAMTATHDKLQKIHDLADATAAWGYAGSLFTGNPALKAAADIPDLVANVTDLTMAAEEHSLAKDHLKYVQAQKGLDPKLQQIFIEYAREQLLKIIKAVCSVVSGVLGLLVLAFAGPVLHPVVYIGFGLVGTIAALAAYFYKETRDDQRPEFFKIRDPQILVNGAPAA